MDLLPEHVQKISNLAANYVRERAPRKTGNAKSFIYPSRSQYTPGVIIREGGKYLLYQNDGMEPRNMVELEGKAQPLDEPVLTPDGWRKMGDIAVGDQVIIPSGKAVDVLGVFPQGALPCYRVEFSDRSWTRCSDNHLWTVCRRPYHKKTTVPLSYIRARMKGSDTWTIPMVRSFAFVENSTLPIHPYLLGILIGDGCLASATSVTLASGDSLVPDTLKLFLPDGYTISRHDSASSKWFITAGRRGHNVTSRGDGPNRKNKLIDDLKFLELWGKKSHEKFIPEMYLSQSTLQDKIFLLQGLMDSDGHCDFRYLGYTSTSERLLSDFTDLVQSLGGTTVHRKSYQRGEGTRPCWTDSLSVPNGIEPFLAPLEKRRERYRKTRCGHRTGYGARRFSRIVADGLEEMQCLLIDSPEHLYVTRSYIVTHNTIPMTDKETGETIFRKVKDVGKQVAVRDSLGRYNGSKIKWRHPGFKASHVIEQSIDDAIRAVVADIPQDELIEYVRKANATYGK